MVMTKEPAAKLALAVRKNVRDEYEAVAAEYKKGIDSYVKSDITLDPNLNAIYPYADAAGCGTSVGAAVGEYFDSAVKYIKEFTEEGKNTDRIEIFNELVSEKKIILVAEEDKEQAEDYSGCRVVDGMLQIVFRHDSFYTYAHSCCQKLLECLDKATYAKDRNRLPLAAKASMKEKFDTRVKEIEKLIAEELEDNKLTLHFDPLSVWTQMVAAKDALPRKRKSEIDLDNVMTNMGYYAIEYFDQLRSTIASKFGDDEMMVEGLLEAVEKREACLEMVSEGGLSEGKSYNDCVLKDGRLLLRTVPSAWGTNISYVTEGLVDLL